MDESSRRPLVVSLAMGYGHLRAAHALAEALGTQVLHADRPPLADDEEQALWRTARNLYEWTSRASQIPVLGTPLRWLLETVTSVPRLDRRRDLTEPDRAADLLAHLFERGLGVGLARRLAADPVPLVTTYFAPALAVDDARRRGGGDAEAEAPPIFCVVTDVVLARAWVARDAAASRVHYFAPTRRAVGRLRAYGVPDERISRTGFPLPGSLLGGTGLEALKENLAGRLVRLDPNGAFREEFGRECGQFLGRALPAGEAPRPPRLAYVVGGAGAQVEIAEQLVKALAGWVRDGRLRVALVAGTRGDTAAAFTRAVRAAGLGALLAAGDDAAEDGGAGDAAVEVLYEPDHDAYFRRFNRLLASTDVLWTKPSELTFFAALGLPLVLAPPVGVQERHNRRWAQQRGAAVRQGDPRHAEEWLDEWLHDGTLAIAAWNGFLRLPKFGLYQIRDRVTAALAPRGRPTPAESAEPARRPEPATQIG